MTNTNNSSLRTAITVNTLANVARGDFRGTENQLGRFTTEALIDAAEYMVGNMSTSEREKFGPYERITNRERAIMAVCSVVHAQRMREFGAQMDRARAAAVRELPAALAQLGAAL